MLIDREIYPAIFVTMNCKGMVNNAKICDGIGIIKNNSAKGNIIDLKKEKPRVYIMEPATKKSIDIDDNVFTSPRNDKK